MAVFFPKASHSVTHSQTDTPPSLRSAPPCLGPVVPMETGRKRGRWWSSRVSLRHCHSPGQLFRGMSEEQGGPWSRSLCRFS
ncbi:hypothetical protein AAFF_G00247900 [Aldrovandia affinis]|uniref:Uncharacterized protein n=1 Tax=Aldrovandia affinis TaxID=143900 RepID=A0AAD7RDH1_9TELE|nr:hypothetical protein AAFF_G00247900 [Aldrovandia affinis]